MTWPNSVLFSAINTKNNIALVGVNGIAYLLPEKLLTSGQAACISFCANLVRKHDSTPLTHSIYFFARYISGQKRGDYLTKPLKLASD